MPTVEFSTGSTVSMTPKKVRREMIKIYSDRSKTFKSNLYNIVWCNLMWDIDIRMPRESNSVIAFSFLD